MSSHTIICLWFPYLSVENAFKDDSKFKKKPFSTTSGNEKSQTLFSVNPVGESIGLKNGISLYEAYILCENLKTKKRNYKEELSFLQSQAKWCYQLTPRVSIEKEDILVLDIKGCTHLFGDTTNIIKIIHEHFKKINITIFSSLGESPSITKSLVKFYFRKPVSPHHKTKVNHFHNIPKEIFNRTYFENLDNMTPEKKTSLKKIPIESLKLNSTEIAEMKYLGIETIDDLQHIPHKDLLIRFKPKIIENLKKIVGTKPELTTYLKPKRLFSNSIKTPEPTKVVSNIKKLLETLIISVCHQLKINHKGTRSLKIDFYETNNRKQSIQIQTSEFTSNSMQFIRLLNLKIPLIKSEFGIDLFRVSANKVENLFPAQNNMNLRDLKKPISSKMVTEKEEYKDLISRLGNKLGFDNLIHFHPNESHIPEKNASRVSAAYCSPALFWPIPKFQRPTLIFEPEFIQIIKHKKTPLLFIWRQKKYNVSVSFGPERIAPEWWFDDRLWRTGLRDYWKIETVCGNRLWLFEAKGAELKGGWFVHGTFV